MPRYPKPSELHPVMQELTRRREMLGISRRQLAEKLGYSYDAVYGWEVGIIRPTLKALLDWISFLDLTLVVAPKGSTTDTDWHKKYLDATAQLNAIRAAVKGVSNE